jgi:hypothetical protein
MSALTDEPESVFTSSSIQQTVDQLRTELAMDRPSWEEYRQAFTGPIDPDPRPHTGRMMNQAEAADAARRAYGDGPPDFSAAFDSNEELIKSTRDEFPRDPYMYGRRHPPGPSRWTPPADPEEKVARCP